MRRVTRTASLIALSFGSVAVHAAEQDPLVLAEHSSFFAGGGYVAGPDGGGDVFAGQIYVHSMIPAGETKPYPIVFITGFASSGVVYETTPDGREGWAPYFVRRGYKVYVTDQPARGRSAYHPDIDGPYGAPPRAQGGGPPAGGSPVGTPSTEVPQWPGEGPGKGKPGDPVYDRYRASQLEGILTPPSRPEALARDAVAALLDTIGPAILVTHSQGGPMGWLVADARPNLVKGVIAIEPGPVNSAGAGWTPTTVFGMANPNYGVSMAPISYDPPLADPTELVRVAQAEPDAPGLGRCWLQGEPARMLPNLVGIPILVVAADQSPRAGTTHCVSNYLRQAGVENDFVALGELGITGNGHLMMYQKNSDEIAAVLAEWLQNERL